MTVPCRAGHCRFATSSIPTAAETHPHQWTPTHSTSCWQAYPGNLHDNHITASTTKVNGKQNTGTNGVNDDSARAIHGLLPLRQQYEQLGGSQTSHDQSYQTPPLQQQPDQAWQLGGSQRPHGLFVTHNGDFECFELFGQTKACAEVTRWLTTVLDVPCPALCDSVAIAGEVQHKELKAGTRTSSLDQSVLWLGIFCNVM